MAEWWCGVGAGWRADWLVAALLQLRDYLEVTVEGGSALDLSALKVARHAGVLLDGVGDATILKQSRGTLQGRPTICQGGKSATMMHAYDFTLCHRAVVVTMDLGACNLHLFSVDHWLSDEKNCLVLRLDAPAWETVGQDGGGSPTPTAREQMAAWTVSELASFLNSQDLSGPSGQLRHHGVSGEDFLSITAGVLTKELGLSKFTAKKLERLRDVFVAR